MGQDGAASVGGEDEAILDLLPVVRREMRDFLAGLNSGEIAKVPQSERTNPASTLPIIGDE